MKDALNVVREFTSEGNLSKNGNINTTTMREMWDYENEEPSLGKNKETKAWVDEQNKINKKERPRYGRLYIEGEDLTYLDPQLGTGSPIESQRGGRTTTLEKEKGAPQPSCALQEFVKHIADPLVDEGWNLHLKFGKGESQKEQFVQGSSPQKPISKNKKRESQ